MGRLCGGCGLSVRSRTNKGEDEGIKQKYMGTMGLANWRDVKRDREGVGKQRARFEE